MLRWRLISAAVILAVVLTLVWLDFRQALFGVAGFWLFPVLLAISWMATEEMLSLLRAKGHRPVAWTLYLGNTLLPLAASLPMIFEFFGWPFPEDGPLGRFGWPNVALAIAAIGVLISEMRRFERPGATTVQAALGMFTLVYVGLMVSFLAQLRLFGVQSPSPLTSGDWGLLALVSTLVVVKFADVGAYTFGRTFGRTKLTPRLSPGKTWEGAIGGVATACVASWVFFRFAGPWIVGAGYVPPPLWGSLGYGIILALAGMTGDLAESMLKRDMERKDSSTWLPGLGGVLDIVDSVLVAAPVSYLCWVVGLVGPGG